MKSVLVKVLRTHPKKGNQFWQSFEYDGDLELPVSAVLDEINSREKMIDTNLDVATPILWECSRSDEACGGCAMVINHVPRLACSTLLSEVLLNGEVEIRPLTKFTIVADLKVDRTVVTEGLKDMKIWLEKESLVDLSDPEEQIEISKCLACGCCLEACPNYSGDADFVGAMASNEVYTAYKQAMDPNHIEVIKKKYKKKFFNGCSKSLICEKVCPMGIPLCSDMSKMSSLSVWRIWQQK